MRVLDYGTVILLVPLRNVDALNQHVSQYVINSV